MITMSQRLFDLTPPASSFAELHGEGELVQREYLVDGQLRTFDGPLQEVLTCACFRDEQGGVAPRILGHYPLLTPELALTALDAAVKAYDSGRGVWPTLPLAERIGHLEHFVRLMKEQRPRVVELLMWEIGKSREDSLKEFDRTVDYVRDTLEAVKELDRTSSRFVIEQGVMAQIRRAPLGVVLCMGPYNYPLNETFTTLIPALLMGNTVVFKPPRLGVLLHRPLLEAFRDAFPPGVVNTVYGEGRQVVGPLISSGKVDVLAFIGSSRVADLLKHQHPKPHRLRCILGLEAKNAGIVLPDADLDLTLSECLLGSLSYNGQRCTALKILFVHRSLLQPFLERLSAGIAGLKLGMPWEPGVKLTPLPEVASATSMKALLDDARQHGAQVVNPEGGTSLGTLFYPALVHPVTPAMRLWREEQFGPLVPVAAYDDPEEPVRYVVESNYGQQVSLFGQDPELLGRLIDPLVNQVCRVNLNSQCQRGPDVFPFTGRKDSAEATLSVSDALRAFTIRTLVAAKTSPENKKLVTDMLRGHRSAFLSTDFIL